LLNIELASFLEDEDEEEEALLNEGNGQV